jgi:sec-independent protein translocase protein TatA
MQSLFLINFLGPEMLVVFFAILLLFGGKKIPELMKGIGKGIREFNTARGTLEKELKDGLRDDEIRERDLREREEKLKEREKQNEFIRRND